MITSAPHFNDKLQDLFILVEKRVYRHATFSFLISLPFFCASNWLPPDKLTVHGGKFLALRLCVGPLLYIACIKEMKPLLLFRFLATPGIISDYHIILWFPWPGIIKIVFPEHQFYSGNKSQSTCLVHKVMLGSLREKKNWFLPTIFFCLVIKIFLSHSIMFSNHSQTQKLHFYQAHIRTAHPEEGYNIF